MTALSEMNVDNTGLTQQLHSTIKNAGVLKGRKFISRECGDYTNSCLCNPFCYFTGGGMCCASAGTVALTSSPWWYLPLSTIPTSVMLCFIAKEIRDEIAITKESNILNQNKIVMRTLIVNKMNNLPVVQYSLENNTLVIDPKHMTEKVMHIMYNDKNWGIACKFDNDQGSKIFVYLYRFFDEVRTTEMRGGSIGTSHTILKSIVSNEDVSQISQLL